MPSTQRRAQTGLIDRMIEQPCSFRFFQAVRLIDLWLRRDGAQHGKTLGTVLRCKHSVALAYPPSEIETLSIDAAPGHGDATGRTARGGCTGHAPAAPYPAHASLHGVSGY